MPDRVSYLKARYCRAVLRTALNSQDEDAKRLVYCLATEQLTPSTAAPITVAEFAALEALAQLAHRINERGVLALTTHWRETNDIIEHWIEVAYQNEDP